MSTSDQHVSVLVVGGGYVGLAATLFLARQGTDVLLVDRHPGVSIHGPVYTYAKARKHCSTWHCCGWRGRIP